MGGRICKKLSEKTGLTKIDDPPCFPLVDFNVFGDSAPQLCLGLAKQGWFGIAGGKKSQAHRTEARTSALI
ncbi:MAG: hypothetical protein ACU4EQ_04905 [Candidatus Nitrosoglobus sp.]